MKAIELGHRDVQHDHVGQELPGKVERLTAVARKCATTSKAPSRKRLTSSQKRDVIVSEEDAGSGWRGMFHGRWF